MDKEFIQVSLGSAPLAKTMLTMFWRYGETVIERMNSFKFLGVWMRNDLMGTLTSTRLRTNLINIFL
jgi:hypothetical protein